MFVFMIQTGNRFSRSERGSLKSFVSVARRYQPGQRHIQGMLPSASDLLTFKSRIFCKDILSARVKGPIYLGVSEQFTMFLYGMWKVKFNSCSAIFYVSWELK